MSKTQLQTTNHKLQTKIIAQVIVNLPVDGPFDYYVPDNLAEQVSVGCRVWISFGPRRLIGYVAGFSKQSHTHKKLKAIESIIDSEPILDERMITVAGEIAKRYMCSVGEAIEAAIPSGLKRGKTSIKLRKEEPEIEIKPQKGGELYKKSKEIGYDA